MTTCIVLGVIDNGACLLAVFEDQNRKQGVGCTEDNILLPKT